MARTDTGAGRLGNRAVFKRLGYITEALSIVAPELIAGCRRMLSSGIAVLDPAIDYKGHIVKKWNLRINAAIEKVMST